MEVRLLGQSGTNLGYVANINITKPALAQDQHRPEHLGLGGLFNGFLARI